MVGEKFREACLQGYETVREGRRANDAVWSVLGHAPKCPLLFEEGDVVDGRARLVAGGLVVGVLVSRAGRRPRFYTARTKRAVNSLTVERGPKVGAE